MVTFYYDATRKEFNLFFALRKVEYLWAKNKKPCQIDKVF